MPTNFEVIQNIQNQVSQAIRQIGYQQISMTFSPDGLMFSAVVTNPEQIIDALSSFVEVTLDQVGSPTTDYPVGPILTMIEGFLNCPNFMESYQKSKKFSKFLSGSMEGLSEQEVDEFIDRAAEFDANKVNDEINGELRKIFSEIDNKYNFDSFSPTVRNFIRELAVDELRLYRSAPQEFPYGTRLLNTLEEISDNLYKLQAYLVEFGVKSQPLIDRK